MPGKLADLPQLGARRLRGAALGASARAFPFERHLFGNESLHGIRHVGEPGAAAHFTIRKHIQTNGPLLLERGQDRLVFAAAQLFQRNLSRGVRGSGRQQFGRT